MLLPLAVLTFMSVKRAFLRPGWKSRLVVLVLIVAAVPAVWMGICRGGTNMFSDYYFFTSRKSTTAQTMERFGVPMTFVLELTRPETSESSMSVPVAIPVEEAEEVITPEENQTPVVYNVLPFDFEAMSADTDNPKLTALNNYFSQVPGTKQNAYTGMLQDYNLIFICAESFSPHILY